MNTCKLTLNSIRFGTTSEEYEKVYPSVQDALEEADDLAFSTVGFPLEDWEHVDFGEGNHLYYFYPDEGDRTYRYKLSTVEEEQ